MIPNNLPPNPNTKARPAVFRLEPMKHPQNRPLLPADYLAAHQKFENHQRIANCFADIATHGKRQYDDLVARLTPEQQSYMGEDGAWAAEKMAAVKTLLNALHPGLIP